MPVKKPLRVLVTGGRSYSDQHRLNSILDNLLMCGLAAVAHGAAKGADTMASHWCQAHKGVQECVYRADWLNHGNAAGPIRNAEMLKDFKPDIVVAFAGGAGTRNMINLALDAGVTVWVMDGGATGLQVCDVHLPAKGQGFGLKVKG